MDAFEKATKIFDVTPNPCEINQQNVSESLFCNKW